MEMNTQANATPTKHSSIYGENFKHAFESVHFRFPKFQHTHPAVIKVNEVADERMTTGQRIADRVATGMGSWRFIIIQSVIVVAWIISNVWLLAGFAFGLVLSRLYVATHRAEWLSYQLHGWCRNGNLFDKARLRQCTYAL